MNTDPDHVTELQVAARKIAKRAKKVRNLDEQGLMDLFSKSGLLATMGYGSLETDTRCSGHISRDKAGVTLCSFTRTPIALIEFVRSSDDLASQIAWLQERIHVELGRIPSVAVLSNGAELWMFQVRDGYLQRPPQIFDLADLALEEAVTLHMVFQHRQLDWDRQLRHLHQTVRDVHPTSIPFASTHKH